jgi:hypothetical protein
MYVDVDNNIEIKIRDFMTHRLGDYDMRYTKRDVIDGESFQSDFF